MIKRGVIFTLVFALFLLSVVIASDEDSSQNTILINEEIDLTEKEGIEKKEEKVIIEKSEEFETSSLETTEELLNVLIYYNDFDEDFSLTAVDDFSLKNSYVASSFNGIEAKVTREEFENLRNDYRINQIEIIPEFRIALQDTIPLVKADKVWSNGVNSSGSNGSGRTVCVIDSGVDYTHPDLGGCSNESFLNGTCSKVLGGWDFCGNDGPCGTSPNDADPFDDNGHGTHVAGIAAASGGIKGVAPGSNIVALKACNASGDCISAAITDSLNWCLGNATKFNISSISLSLSSIPLYDSYCDDTYATYRLWADIVNNATTNNVGVVIASGNSGNSTSIGAPACIKNATAVSSSTKTDLVSSFSNRNSLIDIFAPGSSINSTKAKDLCTAGCDCSGEYMVCSGTSMATPHVAGSFALLRSYFGDQGRELTNYQIEDALKVTGDLIDDSSSGLNFSRINLYESVIYLGENHVTLNFSNPTPQNNGVLTTLPLVINLTSNGFISDSLLHLNNVTYSMDLISKKNLFATINNLEEGNYTFWISVNDTANNFANSSKRNITINFDPVINLIYPSETEGVPLGTLIEFNITDSSNISYAYFVKDNLTNEFMVNTTYKINTSNWDYGENSITVFVNDTTNSLSSSNFTFRITNTFLIYDYNGTDLFLTNLSSPFEFFMYREFGSINFTFLVNFTQKVMNQEIINFTKYSNISYNNIFINSSFFDELNTNAEITLYNITFSNPQIMRDGSVCDSNICRIVNYSNNIFVFNVTSFSTYYLQEINSSTGGNNGGSSGGSSGGGGGSSGGSSGGGQEWSGPGGVLCKEEWICGDWEACLESGLRARNCVDNNKCGTIKEKPSIIEFCIYEDIEPEEINISVVEEIKEEPKNNLITGFVSRFGALKPSSIWILIAILSVSLLTYYFVKKRKKDKYEKLFDLNYFE